jgi:hypothetical protein
MEEFNFFGAKGKLKNVDSLIEEEVEKKLLFEKQESETKERERKLTDEIKKQAKKINLATGNAQENLKIAQEVLEQWKKSSEENNKIITELYEENRKLKEDRSTVPFSTDMGSSNIGTGSLENQSGEKEDLLTSGTPK